MRKNALALVLVLLMLVSCSSTDDDGTGSAAATGSDAGGAGASHDGSDTTGFGGSRGSDAASDGSAVGVPLDYPFLAWPRARRADGNCYVLPRERAAEGPSPNYATQFRYENGYIVQYGYNDCDSDECGDYTSDPNTVELDASSGLPVRWGFYEAGDTEYEALNLTYDSRGRLLSWKAEPIRSDFFRPEWAKFEYEADASQPVRIFTAQNEWFTSDCDEAADPDSCLVYAAIELVYGDGPRTIDAAYYEIDEVAFNAAARTHLDEEPAFVVRRIYDDNGDPVACGCVNGDDEIDECESPFDRPSDSSFSEWTPYGARCSFPPLDLIRDERGNVVEARSTNADRAAEREVYVYDGDFRNAHCGVEL